MWRLLGLFVVLARHSYCREWEDWQSIYPDEASPNGPILLEDSWFLEADGYSFPVSRLSSDLWTHLWQAGAIDDPYRNRNFLTERHVWMGNSSTLHDGLEMRERTWTYSRKLAIPPSDNTTQWILVVEGIKMGASIYVDGHALPENITNQFLRYTFPIPEESESISIVFDPSISTDGRFMGCSGGWDWAPYTKTGDGRGSRTGTLGVVDFVYLVPVKSVFVDAVVPKTYYEGPYPRKALSGRSDFKVQVGVHMKWACNEGQLKQHLLFRSDFTNETLRVTVQEGQQTVNVTLPAQTVKLWWPNGMGEQNLFNIYVKIDRSSMPWIVRRVGFRTIALVTINETDDIAFGEAEKGEGSGRHGMYLRVNGALVFSRGANFIPMDIMEGRWTNEAHQKLIESVARANMNTLRVWGGGAIPPKSFYDACDELGILLYHDLMFVGEQNHSAFQTDTIRREVLHIVRKLAHHPSIILWSGCNECSYGGGDMEIYESFVLRLVADEDGTRIVWPSSPSSYGWETGVATVSGLPSGNKLNIRKTSNHALEAHGPYHRGTSRTNPGVNGAFGIDTFSTNIPPAIATDGFIGPQYRNVFVSEFGASTTSSFESMASTLSDGALSLHGGSDADSCSPLVGNVNVCNGTNILAERNYPCDTMIQSMFGNATDFDLVGPKSFSLQLYRCMISQMLWMKGQIEVMRSKNSFGMLVWQLNEVWPTGGWGLVEYESTRDGNGAGGRWKPLMFLLQHTLYLDHIVACGEGGQCFVRNDGMAPITFRIEAQLWSLDGLEPINTAVILVDNLGPYSVDHFRLPTNWQDDGNLVFLWGGTENSLGEPNLFLWQRPIELSEKTKANQPVVCRIVWHCLSEYSSLQLVHFSVECNRLVLYAFFATPEKGSFSINAIHLRPNCPRRFEFASVGTPRAGLLNRLRTSLRMNHLLGSLDDPLVHIIDDPLPTCAATAVR